MPASKKDKEQKTVELKITVSNHTHEGELCMKGSTIKVSEQAKAMLEARNFSNEYSEQVATNMNLHQPAPI